MSTTRLEFERALFQKGSVRIAGVDEAGRGPLAGPVVAAAVQLSCEWIENGLPVELHALNDSKQLTIRQREQFFQHLTTSQGVRFGIGIVDAPTIDEINIQQATHRAMRTALDLLPDIPQHILVDGLRVSSLPLPQTAIVGGDGKSYSIAAASVIAKVTRDRIMTELDTCYPGYGFASHKGYGTARHLAAIRKLGPCPVHRKSFAPVRQTEFDLTNA